MAAMEASEAIMKWLQCSEQILAKSCTYDCGDCQYFVEVQKFNEALWCAVSALDMEKFNDRDD